MSMSLENEFINHTIKTKNYVSIVRHSPHNLVFMHRQQNYTKQTSVVDAFGPLWIVGFSQVPDQKIQIHNSGQLIPLKGLCGFFAPAFSIIQWDIQAGTYYWDACAGHFQLPQNFPHHPFIFSWEGVLPEKFEDLVDMLENAKDKIFINEQNVNSSLSEKVKSYLDTNYLNTVSISQIAEEFGFSWSFMSREFKKTYQLSPVEYRHRLRLFHALKLLSLGRNITDTCYESGFKSLTQFNTHFKKYLGTQPTNYRLKKTTSNLLKSL